MRKYIFALIFGLGIVLHGQTVYAQADNVALDSTTMQAFYKNILVDQKLMETITPEQLEKYIAQGADVNARNNESGATVLMYAAGNNQNPEVIETLLKHGANIEAKTKDGVTVLMFAAVNNQNPEVIETLLKHGANIEAKIKEGVTVLMFAAVNNQNPEVIQTLIDKGAIIQNSKHLLEWLDGNKNIEKNQNYWNLRDKIVYKNILADGELMKNITPKQLKEYIARGADVNAKDKLGVTPLMFAAETSQNPEVVEILLKHKANVNVRDNFVGYTSLMIAAENNSNQEIVEILLKYGADINVRGVEGRTPLMFAILKNPNPKVVQALLRHGANVNTRDEQGQTPLILAAGVNSNPEVIDMLLKYNANIETEHKGATPLIFACVNNPNSKVIQTLIDNGAIIRDGNQLLELLAENEKIEKNQDYWDLRDRIYDKISR